MESDGGKNVASSSGDAKIPPRDVKIGGMARAEKKNAEQMSKKWKPDEAQKDVAGCYEIGKQLREQLDNEPGVLERDKTAWSNMHKQLRTSSKKASDKKSVQGRLKELMKLICQLLVQYFNNNEKNQYTKFP